MAENSKNHWRSLPRERDNPAVVDAGARDEFPEPPPAGAVQLDRRGFLQAAGFALAGVAATGCQRAPVEKAIPYLVKPVEVTPGRAYHYASTCGACPAGCGLLVKNRDGRPIKLEGDPEHPLSRGGLCAAGQASILGLYDSRRLGAPLIAGREASWEEVDADVTASLDRIEAEGGAVRFLTASIHSPTELASIESFLGRFGDARHIMYEPLSSSAILDAHQRTHGVRILPRYRFDRAKVILGFDADFLGTWISPVEYTAAYRSVRNVDTESNGAESNDTRRAYHVQFESRLSITGGKADRRFRIAPGEAGAALTELASRLAEKARTSFEKGSAPGSSVPSDQLVSLAERLWSAKGQALVVCGAQDVRVQILCNFINHLLDSYGSTIELSPASNQRGDDDQALAELLEEIRDGKVDALFLAGVNPLLDLPLGTDFPEQLGRVPLAVSFAQRNDETSEACRFTCPVPHYLESWGDCEPVAGVVTLQQPCIQPFGNPRPLLESLAAWSGESQSGESKSSYDIVRATWQQRFSGAGEAGDFDAFWKRAIHDGSITVTAAPTASPSEAIIGFKSDAVRAVSAARPIPEGRYALSLYAKPAMLDGTHAYNAWLQELPDPITKIAWDNYVCLSSAAASDLDVHQGDVVSISSPEIKDAVIELPVVLQPGQHDRTAAIALGYGAKASERFAGLGPKWLEKRDTVGPNGRVGVSAARFLQVAGGTLQHSLTTVVIERTARKHLLATTQTHHTIALPEHLAPRGAERREVVEETTLAEQWQRLHSPHAAHQEHHGSLWKQDHEYTGHRWGMAIDLDACTGCSACVIACQVENNIPVVGKDEVSRRRDMHWIRIDRYYSGDDDDLEVAHQPMLCQHCENAPCETVCPVLATVHSEEGLNHQIYNRCVGTRYCANNCPYKVRRFNWFDYAHDDRLENLVLNPDVTVRSRGVMEKCSLCVQRIQEAKIEAKRSGVALTDGSIRTACEQSCPASAIHFGDMNDPGSRLAGLLENPRRYRVLEELNVAPAVNYLKIVRDGKPDKQGAPDHG
jgi:molybdopterin-containing oxidoreductase family iron-sulfur binding subunit